MGPTMIYLAAASAATGLAALLDRSWRDRLVGVGLLGLAAGFAKIATVA